MSDLIESFHAGFGKQLPCILVGQGPDGVPIHYGIVGRLGVPDQNFIIVT